MIPNANWAVDPTEYHAIKMVRPELISEATVSGWKVLGVAYEASTKYTVRQVPCDGPRESSYCRHGIPAGSSCIQTDDMNNTEVCYDLVFIVGMLKDDWKVLDSRARLKAGDGEETQQG